MTNNGFRFMGDLNVGDVVYDEDGEPANIIFATDIMYNHTCYDVIFSDGSNIIADAEHLWFTHTHSSRKAQTRAENPRILAGIRTTEDIKNSLYCDDRLSLNHSIECTQPIKFPRRKLAVNPYTLGAWLGDGSSAGAEITSIDEEILNWIQADGYLVKEYHTSIDKAPRFGIGGLTSGLRKLGVIKNKHIPLDYITSSTEQRLALLQGLMDTDGHITPSGHCEYCSVNKILADGVLLLCRTLGLKPVSSTGRASINGRDCGEKYRVTFTPYISVFRLQRKLDRVKHKGNQGERQNRRYIVDVKPVESYAVRCIQVDSPSHLYLAGDALIPTHNTRALTELVRQWAQAGHGPIALIGQTKGDVRDTLVEIGDSSILKISPPWFMPEYEPSKRRLTWPNGVQAIIYSGDEPDQLRGPQHAKVAVDELAKFQYPQATWDNMMMGLRIGDNPQVVVATTPRPLKILKDIVRDPRAVITRGHTTDNADNLAPEYLDYIMAKYEGTRLGRQELAGELLESSQGLVYDAFDSETAVVPRLAIPPDWPRYFGQDFGRTNTAAVWYAQEPSTGFLYLYRTYLRKASVVEHVKNFQELSQGETFRRKNGGNHQEQEIRDGYTLAGWTLSEPTLSNNVRERINRVNSLHAQNKIHIFNDMHEYIDEKTSMAYEVDKDEQMTEKIHNEPSFHLMFAESYILSEFQPVNTLKTGKESNEIPWSGPKR